jgi:predicted peroxiredoxin
MHILRRIFLFLFVSAGRKARAFPLAAVACLLAGACGQFPGQSSHVSTSSGVETVSRPRPEIPSDWPPGKRIVMFVTPSLKQSYVAACDLPVPAWNYVSKGYKVTIAVDRDAVTLFQRDSTGKTPLDRLDILRGDLDDLSSLLEVPLPQVPRNYGDLFRFLAAKGVPIVVNEDSLKQRHIPPSQIDPVAQVLPAAEFKKVITQQVDAFLPYEEIGVPHHSIFAGEHGH